MLFMGIGFVGGLGITASLTVARHRRSRRSRCSRRCSASPALNIERTKWRGLIAAGFVALGLVGAGLEIAAARRPRLRCLAVLTIVLGFFVPPLKREVQHRPPKPRRETAAYRWSRVIQHRPWPFAIGAAALLLVLAIPFLSLRLGFSDESNFADDTTTKQAYDLIVEGFGKGSTGPIYLVAEVDGAEQVGALAAVNDAVAADPDGRRGARAAAERPRRPDRGALDRHARRGGPQDEATTAARQPPARRRPPAGRGGGRHRRARHRRRRRQRRHVATTWRSGCRSSSAPCSRCRSCC